MSVLKDIIKRTNLNDQAYDVIKKKIIDCDYYSGQQLVVNEVANQLSISRTPIRDAFKSLVEQGYLIYDGIHYSIFKPNLKEIEELFSIRSVLAGLAAKQATVRVGDSERKELEKFINKAGDLANIENYAAFLEYDIEFHDKIIKWSGNNRLFSFSNAIREQCWLVRRWGLDDHDLHVEQNAMNEHSAIARAMVDGLEEDAKKLMEEHLLMSYQRLIKLPHVKKIIDE